MHNLFLKLRRRRGMERDVQAELAFHREMAAARGNPIPFGNTTVLQEQARDLWRFTFSENLWRDLVYGLRALRRSPALVATALLSLGLGIGVNTGIFSLAVEFLFSEPSVTDAKSVVSVILGGNSHARKDVVEFVRASGLFQEVVGANEETFINFDDGLETRQIFCVQTTRNFFSVLGGPMASGRGYVPADANEVAVVADHFWRTRLHADPAVVGRTIRLDGRPYTVVGILPHDYRTLVGFGFSPDVYVPRYLEDTYLAIYARLKPGMTIGQARAGVLTVARRLDRALPEQFPYTDNCSVTSAGGFDRFSHESQLQTVGLFFAMLLVVVGLVLLVACLNVASLLLARGSARRQELAIRLSLGAGRWRLFQQLMAESLLLAIAGAALGLLVHRGMALGLEQLRLPLPVPIRVHLQLDWRVMTYAILLTGFATLACGMVPAWRSIKRSIAVDLRRESRLRGQRALVTLQVALSVIVLAAGSLFLRNLWQAHAISPGFDVIHTLLADVNLPPAGYKDVARKRAYVAEGLRAISAIPGIQAAAAARVVPFTDSTTFGINITPTDTGRKVRTHFHWNAVSPDYFRVMSIPLIAGHTFPSGGAPAARQVIINATFARLYLGDRPALGRSFLWMDDKTARVVIGIVRDTKNMTIGEEDEAQLYEDLSRIDNDRTEIQFVLKSATPPGSQLRPVNDALRRVEPNAGLRVATLYSSIGLAFLPSQVGAALLGGMGVLGLLLAAIGLYGVMVYSVSRRTREIGVRLALGADRRDISRMILGSAAKLVLIGSAAGLLCAFFLVKPLALFLVPGLHPGDPLTFVAVAVLLAATALLAVWSPARSAAAVDPSSSLRYE
ncbi:MAG: ADOP family duplicated permease [Bryobacteraceae bacterium]|jgi:putative ABC transport system permease protein